MKKRMLSLALVLCLLLAGCGASDPGPAPTVPATEPDPGNLIQPLPAATEPAPTAAPTTAPTAPPTTAPTAPPTTAPTQPAAIIITKHPTSETVTAGGQTWFVAAAENETQITWEIFSPEGNMYSVKEAMNANPGLILEVLPKDTLGLRQIPESFSGWSARARYDGPGGTVTTDRAKITVNKPAPKDPYDAIIEAYRTVHRTGSGNLEKGVSELVNNWDYLGYTTVDLDGNGVRELILASDANNAQGRLVYAIYTVVNGQAVNVVTSQARARHYLMSNGRVYLHGSNSASEEVWLVYRLSGSSLTMEEEIFTSLEPHALSYYEPYYYYAVPYGEQQPLGEAEAEAMIASWENSLYLPALTTIS